ncbi:MAG: hypothetical protein H6812_01445 [Phycisphaeraceae bacterium]|nr:hypothetical protein [Phycisphaeraceae bacterium]
MSDSEAVAALAKVKIDAFCNGSESDVDSHCSQRLISLRKNDGLMHLPRTIEYVLTDSDKWTNFGAKYWIIIEINDDGVITEIE